MIPHRQTLRWFQSRQNQRVGWVELLRNPSWAADGFRKSSTHPARFLRLSVRQDRDVVLAREIQCLAVNGKAKLCRMHEGIFWRGDIHLVHYFASIHSDNLACQRAAVGPL